MLDTAPKFDASPSVSNHYAWIRTLLALQNTLMASVRTSVSLIGFGFTVAQFFLKMRSTIPAEMRWASVDAPRNLGLVLIGAGVLSLAIFTWQYRKAVDYLRSEDFADHAGNVGNPLHKPSYMIAFTVMAIGVAAFVSILAKF